MKNKWLIGAFLISAALLFIAVLSMKSNTVFFYTTREAKEKLAEIVGKKVKIGGMVEEGSLAWDAKSLSLSFSISDLAGAKMRVSHQGTPPDMFKEGSGVIVEGHISQDGNFFTATSLMVKHSEEYKAPDGSHSLNKKLVEQSIFK